MAVKPGLRVINASEHLTSLGWAGPGHSLDSKTSNRGLAKPLLVTHKTNNRGLGSRSQKERQADQWWLNAFDTALRQINGDGKQVGSNTSALEKVQQHGMGKGSLYGWFKRGEVLGSTFEDSRHDEKRKEIREFQALDDEAHLNKEENSALGSTLTAETERHKIIAQEKNEDMAIRKHVSRTAKSIFLSLDHHDGASESNLALIQRELRRRKKAGEFDPPSTLPPKQQKRYVKRLKRRADAEIMQMLHHCAEEPNDLQSKASILPNCAMPNAVEEDQAAQMISERKKRKRDQSIRKP